MATYVRRNGRIVEKSRAAPLNVPHRRAAAVISDVMPATKHMGTGAVIDSKAVFRAHTRAAGCVEVGTDPAGRKPGPKYEPPSLVPYAQRAIAQLESR